MSSIGSLSSSTSTSIRGYGGLASGLDRDELIEGMTIGTTTKINKQEQKKQQIEWMQEAVRTISDKMIGFHSKYTETLTSPTNLFSSMLWGRNKITTTGTNAKKVSVTGTASSADAITIMGVKQKAENAKWASSGRVSDGKLETGEISTDATFNEAYLEGKTLSFKYGGDGGSTYYITLKAGEKADESLETAEGVLKSINRALAGQKTGDGTKLSDIVEAKLDNGKITFANKTDNLLTLTGGTALDRLGFKKDTGLSKTATAGTKDLSDPNNLYRTVDFAEHIGGKSLTFSYNGTSKSVSILGREELYKLVYADEYKKGYDSYKKSANIEESSYYKQGYDAVYNQYIKDGMNEADAAEKAKAKATEYAKEREEEQAVIQGNIAAAKAAEADKENGYSVMGSKKDEMLKKIAENLEKQLQSAFGKGRITVSAEDGKLSFETRIPGKKGDEGKDTSSVLTLTGGSEALVGQKGALKLSTGESTRLNLDAKITESGISGGKAFTGGTLTFKVDGKDVNIDVSKDDTLKSVMSKINNNKELNMTVSYQEAADKFTFTSKDDGESGVIEFAEGSAELATQLFGLDFSKKDENGNVIEGEKNYSVRGKDAIVSVRYAGSDDIVNLQRGSNTFTVDGLTIGVKETFGEYDKTTGELKVDEEAAVQIDASVDTDKLIDTIKSFVEDYNAIVDMVNSELTTKHEKDYTPLSSEQKSELSDDEISKWEAKAKAGLLFGDSDLRSLSMDLRTVATSYVWQLQEVGISVSSTYSDNGKLSIDESKLRAALEADPQRVEKLFTSTAGTDENGNPVYNGVATNLKKVMEKYVKTTGAMQDKGVLIRKAGSKSSAMSMTDNTYYSQLQSIEKLISSLNDRLKTERDRYVKQFTSLETLISQMNSQSSYLSSMSGY